MKMEAAASTRTTHTAIAIVVLLCVASAGSAEPASSFLLDEPYPLETVISFSAALFHWVDSLAELSGGKTIPVYKEEFISLFGRPTPLDREMLRRFSVARMHHAAGGGGGYPVMLGVFLEAPTLEAALAVLKLELDAADLESLRASLEHFRPKYEKIWQNGNVPRRFLGRARTDPARRDLERFLSRVARFFGVDPASGLRPRLVLVPVPAWDGTHAQAVGRQLLIEIRPWEYLPDEVAPIVHENSHFLFAGMGESRLRRLGTVAAETGSAGREAWDLLREAIPTAIGQGVADRRFQPRQWSMQAPWYHIPEVDAYAKAIYEPVQRALDTGESLDEKLLRSLIARLPRTPKASLTPR